MIMRLFEWKPLMLSHHLAMFGVHWSSTSGDITFYKVTKPHKNTWMKDHITLFLRVPHCKLAIGIVVVEMILIYYVILQNHVIEE